MISNHYILHFIYRCINGVRKYRTNRTHKNKSSKSKKRSEKPPAPKSYPDYRIAKFTPVLWGEFGLFCFALTLICSHNSIIPRCRSPPFNLFLITKNRLEDSLVKNYRDSDYAVTPYQLPKFVFGLVQDFALQISNSAAFSDYFASQTSIKTQAQIDLCIQRHLVGF